MSALKTRPPAPRTGTPGVRMDCDTLDNAEKHPGFAQSGSPPAKRRFSNDWKIFFQWLEKMARFFQRLEKFFGSFPMIGKNFLTQSRREAAAQRAFPGNAGIPRRYLEAAPPEVPQRFFIRCCSASGGAASCRAQADGEREGRGRRAEGPLQERGENRFADRNTLG